MEEFKIKLFEEENGKSSFPKHVSLNEQECLDILNLLKSKYEDVKDFDSLNFMLFQRDLETFLMEFNAENESFSLYQCLDKLNLKPNEEVYINWGRFDDIDKIGFSDLEMYFSDIWFPGPDDINIFDSSFEWLVSINHEGHVSYLIWE